MTTPQRVVALVVVVALGLAGWWWWPTDARRIRAQLHAMADAVSTGTDGTDLTRLAGLATLGSHLAPDVIVEVRDREVRGRDAALSAARAFLAAGVGRIVLDDVQVDVSGDVAAADIAASLDRGEGREPGTELTVDLVRGERAWVVTHVRERQVLRRPGAR